MGKIKIKGGLWMEDIIELGKKKEIQILEIESEITPNHFRVKYEEKITCKKCGKEIIAGKRSKKEKYVLSFECKNCERRWSDKEETNLYLRSPESWMKYWEDKFENEKIIKEKIEKALKKDFLYPKRQYCKERNCLIYKKILLDEKNKTECRQCKAWDFHNWLQQNDYIIINNKMYFYFNDLFELISQFDQMIKTGLKNDNNSKFFMILQELFNNHRIKNILELFQV